MYGCTQENDFSVLSFVCLFVVAVINHNYNGLLKSSAWLLSVGDATEHECVVTSAINML